MTTIAYRDGVMAADTGLIGNDIRIGTVIKIVRNAAGDLCGACGSASLTAAILRWFRDGETGSAPNIPSDQAEALIVRLDGSIHCLDEYGLHEHKSLFAATGSGFQVAMGAMHAGATAEQAVRAAVDLHIGSWGEIQTLKLGAE